MPNANPLSGCDGATLARRARRVRPIGGTTIEMRRREEDGRVRAGGAGNREQTKIRERDYSPFISSSSTGVSTTAAASASLESSLSLELDLLLLLLPRLGVTLLPPPESEW